MIEFQNLTKRKIPVSTLKLLAERVLKKEKAKRRKSSLDIKVKEIEGLSSNFNENKEVIDLRKKVNATIREEGVYGTNITRFTLRRFELLCDLVDDFHLMDALSFNPSPS